MSYIKPDKVFNVPYADGEFHLSPSYDFLHRFEPVGAWILKYWDSRNRSLHNVHLLDEAAHYLIEHCEIEVIYRQSMGEQEHDQFITWQAEIMTDLDFGIDGNT